MEEYNKKLLQNLESLPNRFYDRTQDVVYKLHIFKDKGLWTIEYHEEGESDGLYFEESSVELLLAIKEMMKTLNNKSFKLLIFNE